MGRSLGPQRGKMPLLCVCVCVCVCVCEREREREREGQYGTAYKSFHFCVWALRQQGTDYMSSRGGLPLPSWTSEADMDYYLC